MILADPSGKPFKEQANPERSFYHLMKYWIPLLHSNSARDFFRAQSS